MWLVLCLISLFGCVGILRYTILGSGFLLVGDSTNSTNATGPLSTTVVLTDKLGKSVLLTLHSVQYAAIVVDFPPGQGTGYTVAVVVRA